MSLEHLRQALLRMPASARAVLGRRAHRADAAGHHAPTGSAGDGPGTHDGRPGGIIVFDGVCVLCNGWVRFLLKHDRRGRFRFAAMQGHGGRALLDAHGLDPDDPVSFLLVEDAATGQPARAWTDSDAILRVLSGLGGAWRLLSPLRWLPRAVRDPAYRWIARHRYRLFGRHDRCPLPDPAQSQRFLP
jgi:predicted DCC family thiol-disulfide oxidoreductase YuxK